MPAALWDPAAFLLALGRIGGLFAAVPIPGARWMADPARVVFVVGLTTALAPLWPQARPAGPGQLVLWLAVELVFGLGVGLALGVAAEALVFSAQAMALQAGYAYASSIDPASQADSPVLQVLAQLTANLLFFSAGIDHVAVRAIARSLEAFPPGAAAAPAPWMELAARAGAAMLELGLRLALPVIGLLVLTDLALSLASRIQAQLQLLSLAFPVKMLMTLVVLAATAPLAAWIYRAGAARAAALLRIPGLG
jgi:flagellar biosynthetic protein FliR